MGRKTRSHWQRSRNLRTCYWFLRRRIFIRRTFYKFCPIRGASKVNRIFLIRQTTRKYFFNNEKFREYERCRCIFKYALDNLPKEHQAELYKYFSQFEKRFGSRQSVEDIVWNKRRTKYEDKLAQSPNDYDTWFDYLRMVEESEKYFFNHLELVDCRISRKLF